MNESCFVLDQHVKKYSLRASSRRQLFTGRQGTFLRQIIQTLGQTVIALTSDAAFLNSNPG